MPLRPPCLSAGSSGHSRIVTTFASRKLLQTWYALSSTPFKVGVRDPYQSNDMYVPHTVTPTIGARRRMAREPKAKASTVRVTFPATPVLFAEERSWVGTRDKSNVDYMPTVADVERNPSDASQARGPYETPIARRGSERNGLCLRGSELLY